MTKEELQANRSRDQAWAWFRDAEPFYQELVNNGTTGDSEKDQKLIKLALQCVLGELAWRRRNDVA